MALEKIRADGYAGSQEESEEGVASLAVALRNSRAPRLAVNTSVPVSRMTTATREAVLDRLMAAAEEMDYLLL